MDYKEIKKNQKIIKRHYDAYSVGLYTETTNKYRVGSEKWIAFDLGRITRVTYRKKN